MELVFGLWIVVVAISIVCLIMEKIQMSAAITTLAEQVKRNTEATASAIILIQGLAVRIEELKEDPAALASLAEELRTSADILGAAVVANTPV